MTVSSKEGFESVLLKYRVTICEHSVLSMLALRDTDKPDRFAGYLARYHAHVHPNFSCADYSRAIDECLSKGWCTVLTKEDKEKIKRARAASTVPQLDDPVEGWIGVLDFTQQGFDLDRNITLEVFGVDHVMFNDSGWNVDQRNCRVDVYAQTEALCQTRVDELRKVQEALSMALWPSRKLLSRSRSGPGVQCASSRSRLDSMSESGTKQSVANDTQPSLSPRV